MNLSESLRNFWAQRAPRERKALVTAAVFLLLLLIFLVAINPALNGVGRLQRQIPQTRNQAAQLEALVAEARNLRALPPAAGSGIGDARAGLDSSLESAGLPNSRNAPLVNGELHLVFANVPYSKWARWLAGAERTLGVHTVAVHIKATPTPGNADVDLTVRLPRG